MPTDRQQHFPCGKSPMCWMVKHDVKTTCTKNQVFARGRLKIVRLEMKYSWSSILRRYYSWMRVARLIAQSVLLRQPPQSGRKQCQGSSTAECFLAWFGTGRPSEHMERWFDLPVDKKRRTSWRSLGFGWGSDDLSNSASRNTFRKAIHKRLAGWGELVRVCKLLIKIKSAR